MGNRCLLPIVALVIFCLSPVLLLAQNSEKVFKAFVLEYRQEFSQAALDKETQKTDKEIGETTARQINFLNKSYSELDYISKNEPKSIWADDALYMLVFLNTYSPANQLGLLKEIIEKYPDFKIEDWTKENFPEKIFLPPQFLTDEPDVVNLYRKLANVYCFLGEKKKAKMVCKDAIKKFPDKKVIFEKLIEDIGKAAPVKWD